MIHDDVIIYSLLERTEDVTYMMQLEVVTVLALPRLRNRRSHQM